MKTFFSKIAFVTLALCLTLLITAYWVTSPTPNQVNAQPSNTPGQVASFPSTLNALPVYTTDAEGTPVLKPSNLTDNGTTVLYKGGAMSAVPCATATISAKGCVQGDNATVAISGPGIISVVQLKGQVTATTATTATATITGVATTSRCTFTPTNLIAATAVNAATAFLTPTTNTVTLTFGSAPGTTGGTFSVICE